MKSRRIRHRQNAKSRSRSKKSRSLNRLQGGKCPVRCKANFTINKYSGKKVYGPHGAFYENWVQPQGKMGFQRQEGWYCEWCGCVTYEL